MHMRGGGEIFSPLCMTVLFIYCSPGDKIYFTFFFIVIICGWTTRGLSLEIQWPRSDPERRVCVCVDSCCLLSLALSISEPTPPALSLPPHLFFLFLIQESWPRRCNTTPHVFFMSVSFTDVALTLAVPRQSADAFSARPRSKPRPRPSPRPQTDSSLQSLWAPIV